MYYNTEDLSCFYQVFGDGEKNIIILPGWGETRESFNYLIDYFKSDYKIYIIDYPGFGNSPFPKKDLQIYDYATLIIDFLNDLEIHNPIIISHSFGGRLAILLNGYYNVKFDKIIMMASAGIKPRRTLYSICRTYLYKGLKKMQVLLPKRKRMAYLQRLLNRFASSDYNSLDPKMMPTFRNVVNTDLSSHLKQMKSEVLLLSGKLDCDTPLSDGLKMNNKIKNSAIIIFPDCSHYLYLQQPNLTHKIIEEFIKE